MQGTAQVLGGKGTRGGTTGGSPLGGRPPSSRLSRGEEDPQDPVDSVDSLAFGEVPPGGDAGPAVETELGLEGEFVSGSPEPTDEKRKRRNAAMGGSGRTGRRARARQDLGWNAASAPLRSHVLGQACAFPSSTIRREQKRRSQPEHVAVKEWLVFVEPSDVVLGGAHRSVRLTAERPRLVSDSGRVAVAARTRIPENRAMSEPSEVSPLLSSGEEHAFEELELKATMAKFSESAIFLAHQMRSRSWSALFDSGSGHLSALSEQPRDLELVGAAAARRSGDERAASNPKPAPGGVAL